MFTPKDVIVLASRENPEQVAIAQDSRPIRIIPNIGPGIAWNRQVYPVLFYNGDLVIFREDVSFEKSGCDPVSGFSIDNIPLWNPAGSENDEWWIESQFYGHYVVFNGDEGRALAITTLLKASDFQVIRFARSFRPASNGVSYDWFIRVHKDEDKSRLEAVLKRFFNNHSSEDDPIDSSVDEYLERIGELLVDEGYLQNHPSRADLLSANIYSAIWQAFEGAYSQIDELDTELDSLQIELEKERESSQRDLREQKRQLHKTLQELESLKNKSGAEDTKSQALLSEVERLEGDKLKLESKINDLRMSLKKWKQVVAEKSRRRPKTRDIDFMQAIALGNSEIAIDEDSMECFLRDFSNREGIIKHLALLQSNNKPLKRVEGKAANSGWMKYGEHIKDGQGSMGRLYVRESTLPDVKYEVVIHKKKDGKEQARFIDALAKRPHLTEQAPYLR
ncbi:hypothetical protein [Microbulbifer sp. M83]|uniref:hypothetical protein n=1 Tax=Microbulbifer sp. M83 TaxID=3118246 RepID=UPI002FE2A574